MFLLEEEYFRSPPCTIVTQAEILGSSLKVNRSLVHLHLDSNNLTWRDCALVGEGLVHNHTVVGLSMLNNDCVVDACGFVQQLSDPSEKNLPVNENVSHKGSACFKNNCWVCGNWVAHKFEFASKAEKRTDDLQRPAEYKRSKVTLHLSIDSFASDEMEKHECGHVLYRMLPRDEEVLHICIYRAALISL